MSGTKARFSRKGWAIRWNGALIGAGFGSVEFPDALCLVPVVFRARNAARAYVENNFGYIRTRPDLRKPPHNWRMPQVVKINLAVREIA